jgi:hypothetical protein
MIAETGFIETVAFGVTCRQVCGNGYVCGLPQDFVAAVSALNPDGGVPIGDGGTPMLRCPDYPATVTITCQQMCTGRLTEGYGAPETTDLSTHAPGGERLAAMAYLEAVSVFAFERLERELAAHGAPAALRREARRARRDEVRHTAMMARLARACGCAPRLPEAQRAAPVRSLFAIALENAVEGCVRETYGAVMGLVEAETSRDVPLSRALRAIAADECRHAELAWAVHAWAMPRLSGEERQRVEGAMRAAIAELARRDPRGVGLLFPGESTRAA